MESQITFCNLDGISTFNLALIIAKRHGLLYLEEISNNQWYGIPTQMLEPHRCSGIFGFRLSSDTILHIGIICKENPNPSNHVFRESVSVNSFISPYH